ncbi:MAG: hypothetical protein QXJ28_03410 [Candidatus Pacearchaeota archaeon]
MGLFILINKKSQVWGIDLLVAIMIFTLGIFFAYLYALNYYSESKSIIEELSYEGFLISSILLSEGSPSNWNYNNFNTIGITDSGRINQTKLDYLSNISYPLMKKGLRARNNFFINFTGMKINGEYVGGIGKEPTNFKNLVKTERISIYDNFPVKINVYIWND